MVCINISAKLSSIMFPFAILTLFVISANSEGRIYINWYKSFLTDVQNEGGPLNLVKHVNNSKGT